MTRIFTVLVLTSLTAFSACNTVSGAGTDLQAGGKAIEKTAQAVRVGGY